MWGFWLFMVFAAVLVIWGAVQFVVACRRLRRTQDSDEWVGLLKWREEGVLYFVAGWIFAFVGIVFVKPG